MQPNKILHGFPSTEQNFAQQAHGLKKLKMHFQIGKNCTVYHNLAAINDIGKNITNTY